MKNVSVEPRKIGYNVSCNFIITSSNFITSGFIFTIVSLNFIIASYNFAEAHSIKQGGNLNNLL